MRFLPVGYQNFREIITQDRVYVDKTHHVYDLITRGKLYFLARPRRFGKSLLVSTLAYLFRGERELFERLYIGRETDYDFPSFPVLQFGFADYEYQETTLPAYLLQAVLDQAKSYNIDLEAHEGYAALRELIQKLHRQNGNQVVLLVNDFDTPVTDLPPDSLQIATHHHILSRFFSTAKGLEALGHIRFIFIAGSLPYYESTELLGSLNLIDLSPRMIPWME